MASDIGKEGSKYVNELSESGSKIAEKAAGAASKAGAYTRSDFS